MLEYNKGIRKLDLHWNSIREEGLAELMDALQANTKLKELDLSWNTIGMDKSGLGINKLAECIVYNTCL